MKVLVSSMTREWWSLRRKKNVKTFVEYLSIKIPPGFFIGIDKLILKFMWKLKGLRLSKQSRKKNNWGNYTTGF